MGSPSVKPLSNRRIIQTASRVVSLAAIMMLATCGGCITARHVPHCDVSATGMSDLHGSQPIDLKPGECSSTEEKIGTAGMGKLVGKLSEWTAAAVEVSQVNLSARGATIAAGSPKVLTITTTKAQLIGTPIGISECRIFLKATAPDGLNCKVEGSSSSPAPPGAIDGALADAVKKLLTDSEVDAYLRK